MKVILGLFGGLALSIVFIVAIVMFTSYNVDRSRCRNWGTETNRDTKFRVLVQPFGVPMTWDCFTRSSDGKWIPTNRVRDFD